MTFQKGNQASKGRGRPPGSGFSAELRKVVGKDEFRELVEAIRGRALAGDMTAAGILINRLVPTLRPRSEAIRIELPDGTPLDQARAVVAAVVRIEEITDLIRRIAALEGLAT